MMAMKTDNTLKLIMGTAILAVAICLFAAVLSYRTYIYAREGHKVSRQAIESLRQDVMRLETRLAKLDNSLVSLKDRFSDELVPGREGKTEPPRVIGDKEPMTFRDHALKRLERILDSTGLRQLAENGEVDPQILQKIYDEYIYRDQIASHRENLLQKNRTFHGMDDQNYDEQLMSLYQRARIFSRGGTDPADSQKAFGEMLEKYPDAFATGMVIAERAFQSAYRGNISEVEDYYNLLRGNENFSNVVTDRGVEAVPNIEYYLARQYIRDGRIEDARFLLNSLEENYADSYVRTRRQGSGPRWQSVSQVVDGLYQQIK